MEDLLLSAPKFCGEANFPGKSLTNRSRKRSETGPKITMGRGNPGCLRLTRSYAGNLDMDSDQTKSSQ